MEILHLVRAMLGHLIKLVVRPALRSIATPTVQGTSTSRTNICFKSVIKSSNRKWNRNKPFEIVYEKSEFGNRFVEHKAFRIDTFQHSVVKNRKGTKLIFSLK